jgi:hypothetical protein
VALITPWIVLPREGAGQGLGVGIMTDVSMDPGQNLLHLLTRSTHLGHPGRELQQSQRALRLGTDSRGHRH